MKAEKFRFRTQNSCIKENLVRIEVRLYIYIIAMPQLAAAALTVISMSLV